MILLVLIIRFLMGMVVVNVEMVSTMMNKQKHVYMDHHVLLTVLGIILVFVNVNLVTYKMQQDYVLDVLMVNSGMEKNVLSFVGYIKFIILF